MAEAEVSEDERVWATFAVTRGFRLQSWANSPWRVEPGRVIGPSPGEKDVFTRISLLRVGGLGKPPDREPNWRTIFVANGQHAIADHTPPEKFAELLDGRLMLTEFVEVR